MKLKTSIIYSLIALSLGGATGTWAGGEQAKDKVKELESKVERVERNMGKLDLQQRIDAQSTEWNSRKLDALLRASDVGIPDKPPLPRSELEEVKD